MHAPEPVPSYRELLRVPSIGRILVGMALSRIAASMLGVAIVLFALDRFGSPALAGIVTFASVAPGMLLSPIAGALLDRHGRSRLIIADQLVGAASLVLIALLALADALTPALLIAITAVTSLTAPLSNVGLRTLFPIIVPRRLWERVNAVDSNGYVLATLVGPPVAGVLVQVAGGPQALLVIAALYGISALVFLRIADPPSDVRPSGRLIDNAWQGLRYTLRHPTLRALGLSIAILNLGWGIVTIAIPVLLIQDMGLGESVVGLVFAVSGVTGGISALIAGRWRTQGRERAMLVWPMVGMAVAAGAIMVSPTLPMLVAAMAVQGFLNGPLDVALFTLRQRRTDPAWLGRAFAVSMSLNFSGYPIGAALGGALLAIGPTATLAAAAIATAGGALVAWWLLPREGQPEPVSPGPGGAGEPSSATRPGDAADSADAPA
jgi:MFS family permease